MWCTIAIPPICHVTVTLPDDLWKSIPPEVLTRTVVDTLLANNVKELRHICIRDPEPNVASLSIVRLPLYIWKAILDNLEPHVEYLLVGVDKSATNAQVLSGKREDVVDDGSMFTPRTLRMLVEQAP